MHSVSRRRTKKVSNEASVGVSESHLDTPAHSSSLPFQSVFDFQIHVTLYFKLLGDRQTTHQRSIAWFMGLMDVDTRRERERSDECNDKGDGSGWLDCLRSCCMHTSFTLKAIVYLVHHQISSVTVAVWMLLLHVNWSVVEISCKFYELPVSREVSWKFP